MHIHTYECVRVWEGVCKGVEGSGAGGGRDEEEEG